MPYRPFRITAVQDKEQRDAPEFNRLPEYLAMDEAMMPAGKAADSRLARQRPRVPSLDMRLAYVLSVLVHLVSPVAFVVLAILVMLVMGIDLEEWFLQKPIEPIPQDLEFVLTPPNHLEQDPLDKNTRFRAEQNSRAGGQHDPARQITPPEPAVAPSRQAVAQAPSLPSRPKAVQQPAKPSPPAKTVTPPKKMAAKNPSAPLPPRVKPVIATPLAKSINQGPPSPPQDDTGPLVRNADTSAKNSGSVAVPVIAGGSVSSTSSNASAGSVAMPGTKANPSPGNKNGALGVDAIRDPDFGPYMKELQRRIKQSWRPPRGNESRRVVVVFRVNRAGQLEDVQISKSSGLAVADQAAIAAVERIFPFKPLPPEYAEENIDIEFTFDYNVFGDKQRLGNRLNNG